ncbi:MAG: PilZ domain-containing protein [Elusimicrobiales bacterium]|nr:PilZ domain-containing protein [Elusimicrobiales bacterium]
MRKPIVEIKPKNRNVVMWSYVEKNEEDKIEFLLPIDHTNILNINEEVNLIIRYDDDSLKEFSCLIEKIDFSDSKVVCKIQSEIKRLENRKNWIRIPVNLDVTISKTLDGINSSSQEISTKTCDISIGGISIYLEQEVNINKGDMLLIKITIDNNKSEALGWVCDLNEKKQIKIARISFISIDDVSDANLARFIYSYQRTFGYIIKGG